MSNKRPYSKGELAKDLRALSGRCVASKGDLREWYEQAEEVHARLSISCEAGLGNIPELVWHYLSDADIRFKDPRYREIQEREIAQLIDDLGEGRGGGA